MSIAVHDEPKTFHLSNDAISYVMAVLPNGHMGQLYFGGRIHDRDDFSHLIRRVNRAHSAYVEVPGQQEGLRDSGYSLEHLKQEYAVYGNSDYREPALDILQADGSRICDFRYEGHEISAGKPKLAGLPATYTEADEEAETLVLFLRDPLTNIRLELTYTIFAGEAAIARSARLVNEGEKAVFLDRVMSICMDLPEDDYEWMQFSGAWARERCPVTRKLAPGITAVGSLRGHSSHHQNPFIILKREQTGEDAGEAIGFSLVYSGNFLAQAEVDTYGTTRVTMGIHPQSFSWKLEPGESFQTPEAVMAYTENGLNALSQTYHRLYRTRLARGVWRDRERPILINNWEATYFDFNEEKILRIAKKARECGVELFVLDDGWFGARRSDTAGLGDWVPSKELLPDGIAGLAAKVNALGLAFGLWIEPEMVNPDSDLFRAHPDWALAVPGRYRSLSRNQYVLDFSRKDVVDAVYEMIAKILRESNISYIKWDMNRSTTECFSQACPADRQGEIFHRYILGVYDLYERLTSEFPEVLFESCAGGGARFDPGILYYAPQGWCSDDTDAMERVRIQYGTSYCYPASCIGSHVSAVPNHQTGRTTPLYTRANVACFGTFGYELDLNRLSPEEQEEVCRYSAFMKEHRQLLQFGTFYRLQSPFDHNESAWMVVSEDRGEAIVGFYKLLVHPNQGFSRLHLRGLDPDRVYQVDQKETFYGDELMKLGLSTSDAASGDLDTRKEHELTDFDSRLFLLKAVQTGEG